MLKLLLPAAAVAALSIATPASVQASNVGGNATNFCQSSLSNLESGIRKRPLAVANEGTETRFISCSVHIDTEGLQTNMVGVLLTNRSANAQAVNCTLVDGIALPYPQYPPLYFPKSIAILPGAAAVMTWDHETDNAGEQFRVVNLNCGLPAGTEINTISVLNLAPEP